MATVRGSSKISPGPTGSWPLRFDRLVQPVLDKLCVSCHKDGSDNEKARKFVLTPTNSYANLLAFAGNDLKNLVFEKDASIVGQGPARQSKLLSMLTKKEGHEGVRLDSDSFDRLVTWIDTYAQRRGSFSERQDENLLAFRKKMSSMLVE